MATVPQTRNLDFFYFISQPEDCNIKIIITEISLDISMISDYNSPLIYKVRYRTAEVRMMKLKQEKALKEYNYLWREIEKLFHEIAWKAGVSDSAYAILATILELGEGCLQKDICDLNAISKQTIHSSIKKMEQDGLIMFGQESGKDKRIYLTPQGKAFAREKILPSAEAENQVFAEMSKEESQELLRLTEKYLRRFQAKIEEL